MKYSAPARDKGVSCPLCQLSAQGKGEPRDSSPRTSWACQHLPVIHRSSQHPWVDQMLGTCWEEGQAGGSQHTQPITVLVVILACPPHPPPCAYAKMDEEGTENELRSSLHRPGLVLCQSGRRHCQQLEVLLSGL